jgi:hypothetical protein
MARVLSKSSVLGMEDSYACPPFLGSVSPEAYVGTKI